MGVWPSKARGLQRNKFNLPGYTREIEDSSPPKLRRWGIPQQEQAEHPWDSLCHQNSVVSNARKHQGKKDQRKTEMTNLCITLKEFGLDYPRWVSQSTMTWKGQTPILHERKNLKSTRTQLYPTFDSLNVSARIILRLFLLEPSYVNFKMLQSIAYSSYDFGFFFFSCDSIIRASPQLETFWCPKCQAFFRLTRK